MKKRGSSLILVMIIIASIMVVVVGAQRIALVQFSQNARAEDNVTALYAAKAGLEDGLLRYRFDRNTDTVPDNSSDKHDTERYDLSTGTKIGSVIATDPIINYQPTQEYYDLKVAYRTNLVGNFSNLDQGHFLAKDNAIDLTGFPNSNTDYYLRYGIEFINCDNSLPANQLLVQLRSSRTQNSGNIINQTLDVVKPVTGSTYISSSNSNNLYIHTTTLNGTPDLASSVRIRSFGCDAKLTLQTVTGGLSGTTPATNDQFDSLTTTITSTGYFGSAKRTLIAEIDRTTDKVLNVYEYTVFSGQGSIKRR